MYISSTNPLGRALRVLAMAAILAMALVAAACGSDDESSDTAAGTGAAAEVKPATLRLMLDWVPGPVHSGIYYAEDQGLFDKAKLTVNVTKPPSTTAPLTFTAAGRTDIAIAYPPDLMVSEEATSGKVKAVFALVTKPLASLWFGEGTDGTVEGLNGKTVGWFGIPYQKPMLETALEEVGMSLDDVKLVNAGFNTNPALLSGRLDAAMGTYYNAEPVAYPDLKYIPVDELGVPTYDELVIIANAERLESDPEYESAVRRFAQVLQESVPAVRKDLDAAYESISKHTREKELRKKIEVSLEAEAPHKGMAAGCFNTSTWQAFADWLDENEQTNEPVDTSNLVTNEYLKGCE